MFILILRIKILFYRHSNCKAETRNQDEGNLDSQLVIDKIYNDVKKRISSIISIRAEEVVLLLGAVGLHITFKNTRDQESLELSLSNVFAFAGALTSYIRKHILSGATADFECTENMVIIFLI
jgi:hypothetical protein